jgi:hypothetical protein
VAVADIRIFNRYFPKARRMALMLRPLKCGETHAEFFVRERGRITYFCAHEVYISIPESPHRDGQPIAETPQNRPVNEIASAEQAGASTAPQANEVVAPWNRESLRRRFTIALQRLRPSFQTQGKRWNVSRLDLVVAIVLLGLCTTATRALWVRSNLVPSFRIPLSITNMGSQLRIDWDASVEPVRSATSGVLEIRDGESEPVHLPFTLDVLRAGSVIYVPRSDTIRVRMSLMNRKGPPHESVIYYVNPTIPRPAVPVVIFSPTTSKSELSAVGAPASPVTPAPNQKPRVALDEPQRPTNENTGMNKATQLVNRSREPRVFRLPPVRISAVTNSRIRAELPDAPDIRISQSVPPALLRVVSGATLARSATQARQSWGRLIWTGELQKNELISFSERGASRGVLNGRLPGFRIKVNVHPGEVVDGGIAILTNDPSRVGVNEPSHARNGWDVVIYKWIQKLIPELKVVETPGPSNNWSRIVLQNGDRSLSVVVVDWQSMDVSKPGE